MLTYLEYHKDARHVIQIHDTEVAARSGETGISHVKPEINAGEPEISLIEPHPPSFPPCLKVSHSFHTPFIVYS
ncbi:hypothetical protein [Indiicoccus explosivorum]|uniref:hypothetical protein n=1 Tax=Indiicoccus explosivorum TaxID=1917864 RepID=UPI000B443112|nr:hypothetical protein [Indiicoccus explosivorum]